MSVDPQIIPYIAALLGVVGTLAGLVHKGDLDRIKDRDAIIAKQEAVIARFEVEATKMAAAKDQEIAEWRKQALASTQRSAP